MAPHRYPRRLWGEQIPLAARVFAVADAYDAITSDRPHRRAASHRSALREIKRNVGTQFGPKVVEALLAADRKGLIEDKAFPQEKGEDAAVLHLVAPGGQEEAWPRRICPGILQTRFTIPLQDPIPFADPFQFVDSLVSRKPYRQELCAACSSAVVPRQRRVMARCSGKVRLLYPREPLPHEATRGQSSS